MLVVCVDVSPTINTRKHLLDIHIHTRQGFGLHGDVTVAFANVLDYTKSLAGYSHAYQRRIWSAWGCVTVAFANVLDVESEVRFPDCFGSGVSASKLELC